MDTLTKILYFFVAIIVLASIGVSVPYYLDLSSNSTDTLCNLNKNIVTYFAALYTTAALDFIIKQFDEVNKYKKPLFLLLVLFLIYIIVISIIIINSNNDTLSNLGISGIIIAYGVWWLGNYNNKSLETSSSPDSQLGGSANSKLNKQ